MDPEDRQLTGKCPSFMCSLALFTFALHGPPSGIQISFIHSLTHPLTDEHDDDDDDDDNDGDNDDDDDDGGDDDDAGW